MSERILVADSSAKKNFFIGKLLTGLTEADFCLLARGRSSLLADFKGAHRHQRAVHGTWPVNFAWLVAAYPYFWLTNFIRLSWYKYVKGVRQVICLNWPEKVALTAPGNFLGLTIIWLELPNIDYQALARPWRWLLLKDSTKAQLVCFSLTTKMALLALGAAEERLKLIWPGVDAAEAQVQSNIFQGLARKNYAAGAKKFFTIGTVIDLSQPQHSEALVRAVAAVLTVVPHLRLIIIGEGAARQQIWWLAKQLGLEAQIWLVGAQADLKKWYANFDLFVVASTTPDLDDFTIALGAMANAVPVLAPQGLSLEDCFLGGQAGVLTSLDNLEELTGQIIKLEQDAVWRRNLGQNARRAVKDFFTWQRALAEFKTLLNL